MDNKSQKEKSIRLINEVATALINNKQKLTQKVVSNESGLSVITIRRYWYLIKDIKALQKAIVKVPLKDNTLKENNKVSPKILKVSPVINQENKKRSSVILINENPSISKSFERLKRRLIH